MPALDPAYRHRAKLARPTGALTLVSTVLKLYDLDEPAHPISGQDRATAHDHLATLTPQPDDIAGFAILHRCGPSFHFLLPNLWRGNNEVWQTVLYADPPSQGFQPFAGAYTPPGAFRPTFCVWELGIVAHEARAWQRYLSSPRQATDFQTWLNDTLAGPV